jgi:DNA replication ATP-dependent helicase Dna2
MNQSLTDWSSEQFYHGQLQSHASAAERRLAAVTSEDDPEWIHQALAPEAPLVWIEHPTVVCRHVCMEEVDLAHQLIAALLRGGFPAEQIAVLTPFRKQARAIRRRLRAASDLGQGFAEQIVVDTVERMQGQERELVILSCAANEPSFVRAVAEFLFLPARLNVSITRARSKAIVLAGKELLQIDLDDTDLSELLQPWQALRSASRILEV